MSGDQHERLDGGCACGRISLQAKFTGPMTALQPRACDCPYCRRHGAAYLSDPNGRLVVRLADAADAHWERQGDELAEFLCCAGCAMLVAVVYRDAGGAHAAINARVLREYERLPPAVAVSPRLLAAADKVARWRQLWFGDVRIGAD